MFVLLAKKIKATFRFLITATLYFCDLFAGTQVIYVLRFLWDHSLQFTFHLLLHSGMFPEVLFRCENVGRQRDFANSYDFSLFFNPIGFIWA